MKSFWDDYPETYRQTEITQIVQAVEAGECVSVVGLSGSGKSNLLGFLTHRTRSSVKWIPLDGNRIQPAGSSGLFLQILTEMGISELSRDPFEELLSVIGENLREGSGGICLVIDRFDAFTGTPAEDISGKLRYLRDIFKYSLTYVLGTRSLLPHQSEIAELFYGNTLFLKPLCEPDGRWSISSYAQRHHLDWDDHTVRSILDLSGGYPSFLRGICEAVREGCAMNDLKYNPAVKGRLEEFRSSNPDPELLKRCGMANHPWLQEGRDISSLNQLTAQEHRLLVYFQSHAGEVCSKDELIRAVWSEDRIYGQGLRDDSLAQLVRRLREKIEADATNPLKIRTIPGRGYLYRV